MHSLQCGQMEDWVRPPPRRVGGLTGQQVCHVDLPAAAADSRFTAAVQQKPLHSADLLEGFLSQAMDGKLPDV